ncbi:MAG: ATP-dependent helicase [Prevotellaceae bacterium]|nr:ATP-dependent helicase [Candidatus Faecinaster equi]
MEYDLSPQERQKYIAARGKIVVTACPGSGKTTSIVYKLRQLHEEQSKINKHAGVLCLSFTNKAVDEIKDAYYQMHGCYISYPHDVMTIDSFLTQNILFPFWYKFSLCKTAPIIVNDKEVLHSILWHQSAKGSKEVCKIRGYGQIVYTIKPEDISFCQGKYYHETHLLSTENYQYAQKVIEYRLEHGYLTSSDALMVSLWILRTYPIIAKSIVERYPYIIIDEAQDTSFDQYCLLGELLKAGLDNVELVGDVNQSIYEWRFADPKLLEKVTQKEDWTHIPFTHNRRSVQRIIDFYSRLVPQARRMSIISTGVTDLNIPILIYRYSTLNGREIIADFEQKCKNNHLKQWLILTRGHSLGRILSDTTEIPDYWKSKIPYIILKSQQEFYYGKVSAAVQLLAFVYGMLVYGEALCKETRALVKEVMADADMSTKLINMLLRMPDFTETFKSWTEKMPLFLKTELNLEKQPLFEVYARKKKFDVNVVAKTKLSKFFDDVKDDKAHGRVVQTIHSSKGASTDAVLLFLSKDNSGHQISLNLFDKIDAMTEKHRLLYVACSRARQFLALAIPQDYPTSKLQRLLKGVAYEEYTPGEMSLFSERFSI